jgi:hypothetical protein
LTFRAQLHAAYLKLGVNGPATGLRTCEEITLGRGRMAGCFRSLSAALIATCGLVYAGAPAGDEVTWLIRAEIIE